MHYFLWERNLPHSLSISRTHCFCFSSWLSFFFQCFINWYFLFFQIFYILMIILQKVVFSLSAKFYWSVRLYEHEIIIRIFLFYLKIDFSDFLCPHSFLFMPLYCLFMFYDMIRQKNLTISMYLLARLSSHPRTRDMLYVIFCSIFFCRLNWSSFLPWPPLPLILNLLTARACPQIHNFSFDLDLKCFRF